ncbi:AMP-binding protein [Cupriavidus gilardii]|uniref:AMP-binding protein n=1 Tax=Cupriavidus gilardii TaxID=82541 RepID=UPI0021C120BD|nr:AMP-binding protein [Cupriavidus gilardii]MCT9115748.1 AMP-binding protein [Cupriavidus gilardii]
MPVSRIPRRSRQQNFAARAAGAAAANPSAGTLPLIAHTRGDQIVAYREGAPVTVARFLADVRDLASRLPAGRHVFNMCADRYLFTVGLCASLLADKISLLPPAHTPEMVRELATFAPDTFCLYDGAGCHCNAGCHAEDVAGGASGAGLPSMRVTLPARYEAPGDDTVAVTIPRIPADRTLAYLFTSGSTGLPMPHRKSWGAMVRNARAAATRLGIDALAGATLVGTVPAQHMYGLECTVMLALHGGVALSAAHPFYPYDVAAALAAVPAPRVLVASPVHLRTLQLSPVQLPALARLLSATAPLAPRLARDIEARTGAPLLEIYGSTETGHIATRRTAHDAAWQLLPGVALRLERAPGAQAAADSDDADDGPVWLAGGAHLAQPVALNDAIEPLDAHRFLLHGRKADLIKIAGKRTSLAYLNHHLNAIPGVVDGVFHLPRSEPPGGLGKEARLTALVVAPGLNAADIVQALRARIDPVFLPRRVFFVDSLPRNATGKLPRDLLEPLVARLHGGQAARRDDRAPTTVLGPA